MITESKNIGNLVEVLVKDKILYRGSAATGISEFKVSEEETIGRGVYFTSEEAAARGYALRRARLRKGIPTVYEANISNARFIDLRYQKTLEQIFEGFYEVLQKGLQQNPAPWYTQEIFRRSLEGIRQKRYSHGNIKDITFSHCESFTEYLQSLGYDGLIAIEGGEGDDIGSHDTWLIFNSSKPQLVKETVVR